MSHVLSCNQRQTLDQPQNHPQINLIIETADGENEEIYCHYEVHGRI